MFSGKCIFGVVLCFYFYSATTALDSCSKDDETCVSDHQDEDKYSKSQQHVEHEVFEELELDEPEEIPVKPRKNKQPQRAPDISDLLNSELLSSVMGSGVMGDLLGKGLPGLMENKAVKDLMSDGKGLEYASKMLSQLSNNEMLKHLLPQLLKDSGGGNGEMLKMLLPIIMSSFQQPATNKNGKKKADPMAGLGTVLSSVIGATAGNTNGGPDLGSLLPMVGQMLGGNGGLDLQSIMSTLLTQPRAPRRDGRKEQVRKESKKVVSENIKKEAQNKTNNIEATDFQKELLSELKQTGMLDTVKQDLEKLLHQTDGEENEISDSLKNLYKSVGGSGKIPENIDLSDLKQKVKSLLDLDDIKEEKSPKEVSFDDYFNLFFALAVGVLEVSRQNLAVVLPQLKISSDKYQDISTKILKEHNVVSEEINDIFSLLIAIHQYKTKTPVKDIETEFQPLVQALQVLGKSGMLPYVLSGIKQLDNIVIQDIESHLSTLSQMLRLFKFKDIIRTWFGKEGGMLVDLMGDSFDVPEDFSFQEVVNVMQDGDKRTEVFQCMKDQILPPVQDIMTTLQTTNGCRKLLLCQFGEKHLLGKSGIESLFPKISSGLLAWWSVRNESAQREAFIVAWAPVLQGAHGTNCRKQYPAKNCPVI